jgi:hypothetical protein
MEKIENKSFEDLLKMSVEEVAKYLKQTNINPDGFSAWMLVKIAQSLERIQKKGIKVYNCEAFK